MTNEIQFAIFPFEHKGINFVSKIAETSRYLPQIIALKEDFIAMNKSAINDLMPMLEDLSTEEILENLEVINFGGTEMFLELAGTN
jgi:Tfp pilus assembly ATPase PilU